MHEFKNYSKIKAIINGKKYSLWVADDYQKMKKGLSGIDHLPSQSGMIALVEKAFADKGHPLN